MHRFTCFAQRIRQIALRLLTGTQNHMIDAQELRFIADQYVKSFVVDLLITDPRDHLHTAREQGGAMDPAGGFSQSFARFAGLTLEHHDLTRAFRLLRPLRTQAAHLIQAGIDTPLLAEFRNILAGGLACLAQVHGGIKADPAAANNCHPIAHRFFIAQHVEIAQHLRMIDALDRGGARGDPAGEDRFVKVDQILRAHPLAKPQIDPGEVDHPRVIAQGLVKLLFAGDLFGDIKLPADFSSGIKQRHAVPARRGIHRKRQPRRTCTHDRQPFLIYCRHHRHSGFVAGTRVDQAGGDFADEDLIQTGLVAADTGVDLIRTAALRFGEDLRIGEERPRHRHHIGIASGDHILRHPGIVNAVGGHQRDRHFAFQPARHPAERRARHRGGDGRDPRLMPADPGVDDGCACGFNGLRQLDGFLKGAAALHQVEHRQAEDNNKVAPGAFPHRAYHFDRKAHPPGIVPAPFVIALVGTRGEEFVDQIAFGAHHLHAVVTRLAGQGGAAGEVINQGQNFIMAEGMRLEAVDWGLDRRRGHQVRLIAVASGMQNLQGDFAALLVDGIGNDPVVRQLCHIVQHRAALHPDARRGRGHAAGDNQRHPVTGTFGIEGCQPLRAVRPLLQTGMHRAHQHTVFERGEPQIKGGEQRRVVAHKRFHCKIIVMWSDELLI